MTAMKAELWVLEFLLDQDALSESVVRELYEHLLVGGAELSKTIQVRLLLRVLREHAANVSDATINALNCLATSHADPPEAYSPFSKPTQLVPPPDLYLQVKTELVLQGLRGEPVESLLQSGNPLALLEKYFAPQLTPAEAARKDELVVGFQSVAGAQNLLAKYPRETVQDNMLKYVLEGRAAMGPSFLKVVESHCQQGLYNPYTGTMMPHSGAFAAYADPHKKRDGSDAAAAAATITNLQQAAGGQGFVMHGDGGAGPSGMGGKGVPRTIEWGASPDQLGAPQAGNELALVGPDGQPLTGEGPKSPRNKSGAKRRRNGRWSQEETDTLIALVRSSGKGKWKKILEEGGANFKNRSQVDLKDKWRNLERQGVVGPADTGLQGASMAPAQPMALPENGMQMTPEQLAQAQHAAAQQMAQAQHHVEQMGDAHAHAQHAVQQAALQQALVAHDGGMHAHDPGMHAHADVHAALQGMQQMPDGMQAVQ